MMTIEEVVSCWEGWPTRYKLRALRGRTISNDALNALCLKEQKIDFFEWVIKNGKASPEQLWESALNYESGAYVRKINRLSAYNNYPKCGNGFSSSVAEKITPGVLKRHIERVAIGWNKNVGWKNPALNPNYAIYKEVLHGLSVDEKESLFKHEDDRVRFWFLGISIVWDPMSLRASSESLAEKIKKEENKFIKKLYVRPVIEAFSSLPLECSRTEIEPLLQVLKVPEKFIKYKVAKYLIEDLASFGYNSDLAEEWKYKAVKNALIGNIKGGDEKIAAWFFHHYLLEPKTVDLLRTLDKERFLGAWVNGLVKANTKFQSSNYPIAFSNEEVKEVVIKIREKYEDEPKLFLTCLMKLGMFGLVDYKDFKEELLGLYDEEYGHMSYIHDDFDGIESHKSCVISATPTLENINEMMLGFKALKESEDLKKKFGNIQKRKKAL